MGKIKIKEENKGKFTAWAKSRGMTVQQAASKVLRNREKYSPALIKRAQFARNASRWDEGGQFTYGVTDSKVIHRPLTTDAIPSYADGGFMKAMGSAASVLGPIGSVASLAFQAIGAAKRKKEEGRVAEEARVTGIDQAQDTAQAGILNNYPTTFKFGGQFKGKTFGGKPNAIVGGGELVITPDGTVTDMKGPSDINGSGIGVQLPNNSMIINKKDSKSILPLASKVNKSLEVMSGGGTKLAKNSATRNYNKYYSKVLDTYNQQEAKKMHDGGLYADDPYTADSGPYAGARYVAPFAEDSFNYTEQSLAQPKESSIKFSNPLDDPNDYRFNPTQSKADTFKGSQFDKFGWGDVGNIAQGLGEMAPMLYNLGQGLFGKREKMNASDYANPYEGSINSLMANRRYNIDAPLAQNEATFRTTAANMRNLGGSRGQVMSNLTGAQNTKQFADMALYGQQSNMNNQYMGEQANMQYGLGRDASMTRMSVDEGNAMTNAAGRNMTGAAMTGLQQYLLTRRQMKGQASRDKMLAQAIKGYSPYATKWIPGLNG